MYKALIIGCGNIGAMYDFETEAIITYAKAFHNDSEIEFEVYDIDLKVALKVATRYGVRCLDVLSIETYQNYDIVVISTSTETHFEYLSHMLEHGPRLVICEKPIDINLDRLEQLINIYRESKTKVMVNFIRRFQPKIIKLKEDIQSILKEDKCANIIVTYQRGFHNNCSHAIDLLEYLFGTTIDLYSAKINHQAFDEFDADPTMSISCDWSGINVQFIGLVKAEFSHFEIDIYFSRNAVLLKSGGNRIEIFSTPSQKEKFYPKLFLHSKEEAVIENYMANVIAHAKSLLKSYELHDNFIESINLSKRILQLQGF